MPSPRFRFGVLAVQYFLYFGVMGAHLPYFNLYCYHLEFSGWQIGLISAVRSLVLILFSILWSIVADRYRARRRIYLICIFCSAALWGFFMLTADFTWMPVITIFYGIFYSPLIAFLETFAMEALGKNKRRYGGMRAWGSVAFIIMVLLLGRLIEVYSVKIILSFILAGSWVQAVAALRLPGISASPPKRRGAGPRKLINANVIVFLTSAFLMLVSHGAYYAFFSIHLANLGISRLVYRHLLGRGRGGGDRRHVRLREHLQTFFLRNGVDLFFCPGRSALGRALGRHIARRAAVAADHPRGLLRHLPYGQHPLHGYPGAR